MAQSGNTVVADAFIKMSRTGVGGPSSSITVSCGKKGNLDTDTLTSRRSQEDGGRASDDVPTSQGMGEIARKFWNVGERPGADSPPLPCRNQPYQYLQLGF